VLLILAEAQIA